MAEITVTESNFENEVLKSEIPVIVDFWASWCGPCRMLAPVLSEIADEYDGTVKVCKVNVDEEMGLAVKYGINSIPALFIFKNGQVVNSAVGVMPKSQIEELFM